MTDLEHPDITSALRTGYPFRYATPCRRCGETATWFFEPGNGYCRKCALEIADDFRQSEVQALQDEIDGISALSGDDLLDYAAMYKGD